MSNIAETAPGSKFLAEDTQPFGKPVIYFHQLGALKHFLFKCNYMFVGEGVLSRSPIRNPRLQDAAS